MPWITDAATGMTSWVEEQELQMPAPQPGPAPTMEWLPNTQPSDWAGAFAPKFKVKKEKPVEKIDPAKLAECHNCGGLYDKDKMPYFNEGLKMRICASCLPRATTCGYCGDVKDTATWNPLTPINRQCDGCGSPSSGLAVKQHRTFKPQSNVIKSRRDSLWPKKPQSQPSPWDSVPTPKSLSF